MAHNLFQLTLCAAFQVEKDGCVLYLAWPAEGKVIISNGRNWDSPGCTYDWWSGFLPWWLSGKNSAYQCRRHGLDPLGQEDPTSSGTTKRMRHSSRLCTSAQERPLSPPCQSFRSPDTVGPALHSERSRHMERNHRNEKPLLATAREKHLRAVMKTQHSPKSNF